ncbi:MAG: hypothetical protein ACKVQU_09215, partial [Burkholderiales bacterium]
MRGKCAIPFGVGQIRHARLLDEMALAGQPAQDAPDDLRQQVLHFIHGRLACLLEPRHALAAPVD